MLCSAVNLHSHKRPFPLKILGLPLVFATTLSVVFLLTVHFFFEQLPVAAFWAVPGLLILSVLLREMMARARKKSFTRFTTAFMGATTIKLFSTMVFMLVHVYYFPESRQAFLLSVFVVYAIFTGALIKDFGSEKSH